MDSPNKSLAPRRCTESESDPAKRQRDTVIALWLGHESPSTTHMYLEADLAMKERALGRLQPPAKSGMRYKPPDRLLQFLQSL